MPGQLPPSSECAACASRDGLIAEQAGMIEELRAANARLAERVAALERAVGRNSGNSSMPPSSDDLPGKTKPQPRPVKGSGRKRGKQPGAAGSSLPWVAVPDEYVAHRPHGGCGCGADLAEAASRLAYVSRLVTTATPTTTTGGICWHCGRLGTNMAIWEC